MLIYFAKNQKVQLTLIYYQLDSLLNSWYIDGFYFVIEYKKILYILICK